MRVVDKARGQTLMTHGRIADTFWARGVGLLNRKSLGEGEGLIIIPNNSVHCFFMRFTIDVVFVSKEQRIVYLYPRMKPWRVSKIVGKAHYVIELPEGTVERAGAKIGDVVEWQDETSYQPLDPFKKPSK
ncbi:MAG: DUF192 domain-containing protein [Chloroflexota bacterium]|nr:DUF192 domain-containing protein [Chloroflexota bacterium]